MLENHLELQRCPHCNVDSPSLVLQSTHNTTDHSGNFSRLWNVYVCKRCGGVVIAWAYHKGGDVQEIFPSDKSVSDSIPDKARAYLNQAMDSIHAPAGSIMLSASAVDAMLKNKGYKEGSLYTRINQAVNNHLITKGMADWAHEVRLDANDERHADEDNLLPTESDAKKCLEFAFAFGDFLFVLPERVTRGIQSAKSDIDS